MSPHEELARLGRWLVLGLLLCVVLSLMAACGGGDDEDDALREWCATFVGPLTQEQRRQCDAVATRQPADWRREVPVSAAALPLRLIGAAVRTDPMLARAQRLWPDSEHNQRAWLHAVHVVRATSRGWLLERPVERARP